MLKNQALSPTNDPDAGVFTTPGGKLVDRVGVKAGQLIKLRRNRRATAYNRERLTKSLALSISRQAKAFGVVDIARLVAVLQS